jgi:response regulator of citrate/malate metabolism
MASELILKIFSGVAAGIVGITKPIALALKAGFNAYLIKPIDSNKLERLLRKVATSESGFHT